MHRKASLIALMAVFSLASVSALGQSGEKTKVKGIINSRTGETLTVKAAQGNVTVVLTDSTKTKDNKGLLGVRTEKMAHAALIPGLKVDVDGTFDSHGQVVATLITVDGDDLETSQMIQAGLTPTAKQVATNTERLEALERRLVVVEGVAHVYTPPPASTPAPATEKTATPAPAPAAPVAAAESAPAAAEPAPPPPEIPKTSLNLLRVGLTFILLVACCFGFVALRREAV